MKHSLKIVFFAVAIVSVCSWDSIKTNRPSDSLVLENIEALADNEYPSGSIQCIAYGSIDCPMSYIKVKYVITGYSLAE